MALHIQGKSMYFINCPDFMDPAGIGFYGLCFINKYLEVQDT